MRVCLYCVLALLAVSETATAQLFAGPLYGITEVKIHVGALDPDARECNIAKESLDAAARLPLDRSRLKLVDTARATVSILVNPLNDSGRCVANVWVGLVVPATPLAGITMAEVAKLVHEAGYQIDRETFATIPFSLMAAIWQESSVLTGSPTDFGGRVSADVTAFTEEMIAAWIKDNPRP